MNTRQLLNKRVAVLVTDGFEQVEMTKPRDALERAGAKTVIVSPSKRKIHGMNRTEKGDTFDVDLLLSEAAAGDFDTLLIPGGLYNPDTLRATPEALDFVRAFFEAGKPVAAICHGPHVLIDAGVVQGRTLTSWPSIQSDVRNAGGRWIDKEVVVDTGLVTSRKPDDIPAFNAKMIEAFAGEQHAAKATSAVSTH